MERDERIKKWMFLNTNNPNEDKWKINVKVLPTSKILIKNGKPFEGNYLDELIGMKMYGIEGKELKEIKPLRINNLMTYENAINHIECPFLNDKPVLGIKFPHELVKLFNDKYSSVKQIRTDQITLEDGSVHEVIDLSNGGLLLKLFPNLDRAYMYTDDELKEMGLY